MFTDILVVLCSPLIHEFYMLRAIVGIVFFCET